MTEPLSTAPTFRSMTVQLAIRQTAQSARSHPLKEANVMMVTSHYHRRMCRRCVRGKRTIECTDTTCAINGACNAETGECEFEPVDDGTATTGMHVLRPIPAIR